MEIFNFNSTTFYIDKPVNVTTGGPITWYAACKDMPEVMIFYMILQSVNMCLGLPANLMVLRLLHKNKVDSSRSDIFILHLAILDTFYCLIPPLAVANIVFLTSSTTWLVLSFFYGLKDTSPLFLSCICLDRYMAVLHPITFTELKDRSHRSLCAAVVWVLTLAYAAAKCVGKIPSYDKVFTVIVLAALPFMFFCNVAILRALRQSGPGRDEMRPVKKRAFKMVLIILVIIVFSYLPPVTLLPFMDHFDRGIFNCYVDYGAFAVLDVSSSIQPLLYLSREIPSDLCCRKNEGSGSSTLTETTKDTDKCTENH